VKSQPRRREEQIARRRQRKKRSARAAHRPPLFGFSTCIHHVAEMVSLIEARGGQFLFFVYDAETVAVIANVNVCDCGTDHRLTPAELDTLATAPSTGYRSAGWDLPGSPSRVVDAAEVLALFPAGQCGPRRSH
jgi:hypothetical protein